MHTRVNSAHTHDIDKEVGCGNQLPKNLKKKPARLRQLYHVFHTQIIGTKVSRVLDGMTGSSIPGRSVILSSHGDNQSLAASWGSHWRRLGAATSGSSSIYVGRLLGASKVSHVLGGMAGSSILGCPWLCLRMETINVDGGGADSSTFTSISWRPP